MRYIKDKVLFIFDLTDNEIMSIGNADKFGLFN